MSKELSSRNGSCKPKVYHIRIKEHVDPEWMGWFGASDMSLEGDGNTVLIFEVVDQAALHGLLKKVRDSGMTLISVNPAKPGQSDIP